MKTLAGLALSALAMFGAAAAEAQEVRLVGRFAAPAKGAFTLQWAASGFEATFTGRWMTAKIADWGDTAYNIEVDGRTTILTLTPGEHTYTLYAGTPGEHAIRVSRRTAPAAGPTTFSALTAEGKIQPTAARSRRILVIGDSISTGYGVEGSDQFCTYSHATQNADVAYAALAARALGADLENIAIDGRGLYRNYAPGQPTMPAMSWRALPEYEARWNRVTTTPQAIVVYLGANDFNVGDPGPGFDEAYVDYLAQLRAEYPQAMIYAVTGVMLEGQRYKAAAESISGAVQARTKAGDARVRFIEFTPPDGFGRWGCDWHPGSEAQKDMARTLQRAIVRDLGWSG